MQTRNNFNALFLLASLVAAVVFVLTIKPVVTDASKALATLRGSSPAAAPDLEKRVSAADGSPVLVRTNHSNLKHGAAARKCFEDPKQVLFLQEALSGRIHVVCAASKTDFYDLIVRDRRTDTGYVEEVTVFKVDQYSTVDDFVDTLLHRSNFPASFIPQPDWMPTPINFIFGP